jgi:uncharacterized Zn-binding protein involved in type VI secretion
VRNVIRLGDPTSHGGKVISTSASHITVEGVAVVLVGDTCSCPIKGHDGCKVASGNANHTVEGIPVAYDGDTTSCGAKLLSTVNHFCAD